MKKIVITLDYPEISDLEKRGDKEAVAKVLILYIFTSLDFKITLFNVFWPRRLQVQALQIKSEKENCN